MKEKAPPWAKSRVLEVPVGTPAKDVPPYHGGWLRPDEMWSTLPAQYDKEGPGLGVGVSVASQVAPTGRADRVAYLKVPLDYIAAWEEPANNEYGEVSP